LVLLSSGAALSLSIIFWVVSIDTSSRAFGVPSSSLVAGLSLFVAVLLRVAVRACDPADVGREMVDGEGTVDGPADWNAGAGSDP
jgi:hypothetical protein